MSDIHLRDVAPGDIPIFFAQQRDAEANHMAAFTTPNPADWDAFLAHWRKVMSDATTTHLTILSDGAVAGYIVSFVMFGEPSVGYWLGKEFWGQGIATAALRRFLERVRTRPLYARVASDNLASLRVLAHGGFVVIGTDRGFANARGQEIEEIILRLDPRDPPA